VALTAQAEPQQQRAVVAEEPPDAGEARTLREPQVEQAALLESLAFQQQVAVQPQDALQPVVRRELQPQLAVWPGPRVLQLVAPRQGAEVLLAPVDAPAVQLQPLSSA